MGNFEKGVLTGYLLGSRNENSSNSSGCGPVLGFFILVVILIAMLKWILSLFDNPVIRVVFYPLVFDYDAGILSGLIPDDQLVEQISPIIAQNLGICIIFFVIVYLTNRLRHSSKSKVVRRFILFPTILYTRIIAYGNLIKAGFWIVIAIIFYFGEKVNGI